MLTFDPFVNRKKINSTINILTNQRKNLRHKIEGDVENSLKKKFPFQEKYELICKNRVEEINNLKERLYNKYFTHLNLTINQLSFLYEELKY